nr:ankyrin repeat domain-containing protein [Sphingomicrobium sp. B8]
MLLLLAVMMGVATTASAQLSGYGSEAEQFLSDVRDFNAEKAMGALRRPGNNLVNYRGRAGDAALHIAVMGKKMSWVDSLVGFNADVNIRNADGDTPLILAVKTGQFDIASRLLGFGADPNIANRRGETPAILAVLGRHELILEAILRDGGNPDIKDRNAGLSARDYAARDRRNPRLLELIESTEAQDKLEFGPVIR